MLEFEEPYNGQAAKALTPPTHYGQMTLNEVGRARGAGA